jgi:hypothetical protein
MRNWTLSPTSQTNAYPNEILADDPYTGARRLRPRRKSARGSHSITKAATSFGSLRLRPPITLAMPRAQVRSSTPATSMASGAAPSNMPVTAPFDPRPPRCESQTTDGDFALLWSGQPCVDFSSDVRGPSQKPALGSFSPRSSSIACQAGQKCSSAGMRRACRIPWWLPMKSAWPGEM